VRIDLQGIDHAYGDQRVLQQVDLTVADGELLALLGPSGCGKTTLLRLIAGLLPIQSGEILFDGRAVGHSDARSRNAVMVFQNYALFPHMTVGENVVYGLKTKNVPREQRQERVSDMLATVQMEGLAHRKIQELSGGQQQRVALARALVVKPGALLFDEPLSNLDEKLRLSMRRDIRQIVKASKITGIYVTHDQEEAMSIADRIAIMDRGLIQQVGTPRQVYEYPANRFVASFMGEVNYLEIDGQTVMCRPGALYPSEKGRFEGTIRWMEYLGSFLRVNLSWEDRELMVEIPATQLPERMPSVGERMRLDLLEDHTTVVD
jgi:ABC-type Fe3+/spermidine/putrescine transport system ATPase subunit